MWFVIFRISEEAAQSIYTHTVFIPSNNTPSNLLYLETELEKARMNS